LGAWPRMAVIRRRQFARRRLLWKEVAVQTASRCGAVCRAAGEVFPLASPKHSTPCKHASDDLARGRVRGVQVKEDAGMFTKVKEDESL